MTVDFPDIPDREFYDYVFSPWFGYGDFAGPLRAAVGKTIVRQDRLYILHSFVKHTAHIRGDLWECGVYQGGSAAVIAASMRPGKRLVLFDTFAGLPGVDEALDRHAEGDFADIWYLAKTLCDHDCSTEPLLESWDDLSDVQKLDYRGLVERLLTEKTVLHRLLKNAAVTSAP